jgi:hypothetical protein
MRKRNSRAGATFQRAEGEGGHSQIMTHDDPLDRQHSECDADGGGRVPLGGSVPARFTQQGCVGQRELEVFDFGRGELICAQSAPVRQCVRFASIICLLAGGRA